MFKRAKSFSALIVAGVVSAGSFAGVASASTLSFLANTQQGSDALAVDVTLTEVGDAVRFDLAVNAVEGGGNIADLRGFFFDIGGTFGSGYTANGSDVTGFSANENMVRNVGGGVNINGSGQDRFDFGVEFGAPGLRGSDDIRSTSFLFGLTGGTVSIADFFGQNIAIRGMSTGLPGGARGGSSKTEGTVPLTLPEPVTIPPVPLPAAGWMLIAGLGGLGAIRRFRKS